jgi:hypothetical protein
MDKASNPIFHLTYCTSIHPANGWHEVFANLQYYLPALKAQLAPERPFGIGLRLSARECHEVLEKDHLQQFKAFLRAHGLYVFTLNGFPYGAFHQQPVKAEVHAPDWRQEARMTYTRLLIHLLAQVLPANVDGSISTSPLSYKPWVDIHQTEMWHNITSHLVSIVAELIQLRRERGTYIHLNLEPEPDGLLENGEDIIHFYTTFLLKEGASTLACILGISHAEACRHLLDHIRVCFDTCHMALTYRHPAAILRCFEQVGIQIGKVQASSALKVIFPQTREERKPLLEALEPFAKSPYLHQVAQQNRDGTLRQYRDLPEAFLSILDDQLAQWRIHVHVPIFIDRYVALFSTQDELIETLRLLVQKRFCRHIEIETYTWSVLPAALKQDLLASIAREYQWISSYLPEEQLVKEV